MLSNFKALLFLSEQWALSIHSHRIHGFQQLQCLCMSQSSSQKHLPCCICNFRSHLVGTMRHRAAHSIPSPFLRTPARCNWKFWMWTGSHIWKVFWGMGGQWSELLAQCKPQVRSYGTLTLPLQDSSICGCQHPGGACPGTNLLLVPKTYCI